MKNAIHAIVRYDCFVLNKVFYLFVLTYYKLVKLYSFNRILYTYCIYVGHLMETYKY